MRLPGFLPHLKGLRLEAVHVGEDGIDVQVTAVRPRAPCPRCHRASRRVHSRYARTVADLPWSGVRVTLRLRVRRFRCRHAGCPRRIFCERLPSLVAVSGRRTHGLRAALQAVGFALGGRPGARLAPALRLPASRMTLLRLVRAAPDPVPVAPRVLGVDDWALRRGQTYGTVLVDLERHRPIDLLPDRTAGTFAAWLTTRDAARVVEIVSRDRGGAYADGARQAVPAAVQVADRWHLMHNLREAVERLVARHHGSLRATALAPGAGGAGAAPARPAAPPAPAATAAHQEEALREAHRARRLARYEEVVRLREQGVSLRRVAQALGMARGTVRRYVRAGGFPERRPRPPRPTQLMPFEPYLRARWDEGCRNGLALWREVQAQGFRGGKTAVYERIAAWRAGPHQSVGANEPAAAIPPRPLSVRQATWLLLRPPDDLAADEHAHLAAVCQRCPDLGVAHGLAQDFLSLVRQRDHLALSSWVRVATASGLPEFRSSATGLLRDWAAVYAALTSPWSNGQTEGQVTRIKALKRQMFGRARFDLLRKRFLGPGELMHQMRA